MHELDDSTVHYEWNNGIAPRLEIEPGDTVAFRTRDAADGYYSRRSTHADVIGRGPFRGHPLTGPVRVKGARCPTGPTRAWTSVWPCPSRRSRA